MTTIEELCKGCICHDQTMEATLKPVLLAKHPWQLLISLPPPRRSQLQPPQSDSTFNAKRILWVTETHGIRMSARTLCLCLGTIAWRSCDLDTWFAQLCHFQLFKLPSLEFAHVHIIQEEKQQIWKIRHDQTHPATVLLRSWPLPFRRKVWWHPRWSHCKEQVAEHPQFHSPHSFWAPLVGYGNYGQKNMGKYGKYKSGWGSNGWKQICIAKISQILQDNYSFCMNTNDKSHRLRLHDSASPLGSSVSLVMPAQGAPP